MNDKPENKDVLANEVSVGFELSALGLEVPVSVNLKAKSRFISAADRLLGNIVDYPNAWLEAGPAKKRARTAAEIAQIENASAAIEKTAEQKGISEQFVRQAVEHSVAQAVRNQEKKILLLQEAIEDLKQRPPKEEEQTEGNAELDEGFLNRLEKRAEEATETEIREKWAKVLAGEIRNPGTFSPKVMRLIDEINKQTAELFQQICIYRLGNIVPACAVKSFMDSQEERSLENAALLVIGGNKFDIEFHLHNGEWLAVISEFAFSVPKRICRAAPMSNRVAPLVQADIYLSSLDSTFRYSPKDTLKTMAPDLFPPKIPCYILTPEGEAIASLFPAKQLGAFYSYLKLLSKFLPNTTIKEYKKETGTEQTQFIQTWKNGQPVAGV